MRHLSLGMLLLPVLFLGWTTDAIAAPFAYISSAASNTVSVIDTVSNTVIATVPVGNAPYGVAVSPDGTRVYVAHSSSTTVSVIDTATNTVTATVPVGIGSFGVAVSPDGTRVYVTNYISSTVSVIDIATNTVVTTVPVGGPPYGVAVNPAGTRVYVATYPSTVSVIDTATNTVVATVPVGIGSYGVAVHPDGTRVYVTTNMDGTVSVIYTATNAVVTTVPVGGYPSGVAVSPDGARVYVANNDSNTGNTVSVIDTAINTVIATVSVGIGPTGVAVHPDGTRVYVTNYISSTVSVINTATNTVVATVPVGLGASAFGQFIGPATAGAMPFLSFPLNVTCQGLPCTPYTANISAVVDHSVPTGYNCNKRGDCDGVVLAYNGEEGRKEYGENCPPPGYKKDASGTPFLVNVLNYVGAICSPKYGTEAFRSPERFLNYDGHSGYDFPYFPARIIAPADGTLFQAVTDSVNGTNGKATAWEGWHTFYIDHGNGYTTWYLHCTNLASQVWQEINQNGYASVEKGEVIAYVGGYGGVSPHLHFEVRLGMDEVVDPYSENLWE